MKCEFYYVSFLIIFALYRSSPPEVFSGKGLMKIYSKSTREHVCRSEISIKLQNSFTEITLWHGCSAVNLLHIFRTPFYKNTYGRLLLTVVILWLFSKHMLNCNILQHKKIIMMCWMHLLNINNNYARTILQTLLT